MTKRMLIDDTQKEETRVVILDGNKIEDVEFESSSRKQIKGNIYTAKVVRIEPSLQAAFIDYGGNKHGFLAFSEIHPDYYHVADEELEALDREVDEIIENKKKYIKERREQRARYRAEKKALYEAKKLEEERLKLEEQNASETPEEVSQPVQKVVDVPSSEVLTPAENDIVFGDEVISSNTEEAQQTTEDEDQTKATPKTDKRKYARRQRRAKKAPVAQDETANQNEEIKVLSADSFDEDDRFQEEDGDMKFVLEADDDEVDVDIADTATDEEFEHTFEMQRRLIRARKLYHKSTIQDVIKEGQILLVQVVKEERGNKGASFTTYLSLAGRYGVLMPNRIKSGGVSRKITNAADRKRLKDIMKSLPLSIDMSLIIRTAGEDKQEDEIVRDYNYLIRTWNLIRHTALQNKAPSLIYEEGDLIKRALRDMCSNDIDEIIVDGDEAYKAARNFAKILSPQNLKKIKCRKPHDAPVFQHYQVEAQLDKLHNPVVQLESGGYLVINPTEALVAIDVNSGRATKEMDIEETALKTNLEAAVEIGRQLKMRDLAGLIVVDFIDMEDPKNNIAVEKRMKEVLKSDRARVQVARMSCFGLLEISRQRMHSSFMESNYEPCPYCHGQAVMRTIESGAALVLRAIEEEGIKNKYNTFNVFVPTDTAVYLLNKKRKSLSDLEDRYHIDIVISADQSVKNVSDFKINRQRLQKQPENAENTSAVKYDSSILDDEVDDEDEEEQTDSDNAPKRFNRRFNRRRNRFDRRYAKRGYQDKNDVPTDADNSNTEQEKKKTTWWRRLIG